jgi:hypothetical protein
MPAATENTNLNLDPGSPIEWSTPSTRYRGHVLAHVDRVNSGLPISGVVIASGAIVRTDRVDGVEVDVVGSTSATPYVVPVPGITHNPEPGA